MKRKKQVNNQAKDTNNKEYKDCELEVRKDWAFSVETHPQYQQIYNELDRAEEKKLNAYLDTPTTGDGNGDCNGTTYSYKAGQTPRTYLPQACWSLLRTNGLLLENKAKEKVFEQEIESRCARYK